jgi:predicted MarR family transcription regulator
MTRKRNNPTESKEGLHRGWQLGGKEHGTATTELEWTILRFYVAFERSCLQLASISGSDDLAFQEFVLLNVVAMQHHPQTAASLARQLNRDDIANLQYSLRKLVKEQLIIKAKEPRGKTYTYDITEEGAVRVDNYANVRSKLLTSKADFIENVDIKMEDATKLISILTGIYDDVARASATYTPIESS